MWENSNSNPLRHLPKPVNFKNEKTLVTLRVTVTLQVIEENH